MASIVCVVKKLKTVCKISVITGDTYTPPQRSGGGILESPGLSVDTILSGAFILQFGMYCFEMFTCLCIYEVVHVQFS